MKINELYGILIFTKNQGDFIGNYTFWQERKIEWAMIHTIITYLQDAAARFPDKTAFADRESKLTYRQLTELAGRAGGAISGRLGGRRREPVFVCIGRNTASVAAFFAVAASGNFYVPIDPSLPDRRLRDIFETMRPRLVITTGENTRALPFQEAETAALQTLAEEPSEGPLSVPETALDTDPLYCIFTSGSTGVPKGVLISHRSVIDMAEQFTEAFGLDSTNVYGNQAPFDFDVSVKDIYCSVKNGGTVQILEKALFSRPKLLVQRMEEREVNTIIWSVSAMKILSSLKTLDVILPHHLRLVMFSGEALPCKVLNDWAAHLPGVRFVNLYGPTEITCNCTYYKIDCHFADTDMIPIGRPFRNTGLLLLDGDAPVTEPGQTGEICITGTCLALGYYRDPERTAAAFCQNPLQAAWPEKMYRTGDLGAWNEQGELMFIGRADSQVKYMGFRIELGEIEAAANAAEGVTSACCLYDQEKEQICLFYQGPEQISRKLSGELKKTLPRVMVPTRLVYLEKLPENRTGKIDRVALRREYIQN